jgi:hypothetical protein
VPGICWNNSNVEWESQIWQICYKYYLISQVQIGNLLQPLMQYRQDLDPNIPSLINIGSCGLHVAHGALKHWVVKAGWKLDGEPLLYWFSCSTRGLRDGKRSVRIEIMCYTLVRRCVCCRTGNLRFKSMLWLPRNFLKANGLLASHMWTFMNMFKFLLGLQSWSWLKALQMFWFHLFNFPDDRQTNDAIHHHVITCNTFCQLKK